MTYWLILAWFFPVDYWEVIYHNTGNGYRHIVPDKPRYTPRRRGKCRKIRFYTGYVQNTVEISDRMDIPLQTDSLGGIGSIRNERKRILHNLPNGGVDRMRGLLR